MFMSSIIHLAVPPHLEILIDQVDVPEVSSSGLRRFRPMG